jgi:hypothetical protein
MRLLFIIVFAVVIAGCKSPQPVSNSVGISADRAWHLAAMYYTHYISGCGGVGEVVARDSYWDAPVHFGYAGTFQGYIHVNRQTGRVSYSWRHPSVSAASLDEWFYSVTHVVQPNKSPEPTPVGAGSSASRTTP